MFESLTAILVLHLHVKWQKLIIMCHSLTRKRVKRHHYNITKKKLKNKTNRVIGLVGSINEVFYHQIKVTSLNFTYTKKEDEKHRSILHSVNDAQTQSNSAIYFQS